MTDTCRAVGESAISTTRMFEYFEKGSVESTHKVPTSHYRTKHCHSFIEKGSVESTHKVPTSHYHTKHCHAAVVSLGGLTHR